MAYEFLAVDPATGKTKRSGITATVPGAPVDYHFDVTVDEGQTEFEMPEGVEITESKKIDFLVNGTLWREGETHSWTRDSLNDMIVSNQTVQKGAWVLIRIYG